jgi:hypothetical protein
MRCKKGVDEILTEKGIELNSERRLYGAMGILAMWEIAPNSQTRSKSWLEMNLRC